MRFAVFTAVLLVLGCMRSEHLLDEETSPTSGVAETPIADAALESVAIVPAHGATLIKTSGFALSPVRLPTAQSSRAACSRGETFYIAGGSPAYPSFSGCTTEFLSYDPTGESVNVAGALTEPIQGLKLLLHPDGNIYKVMGDCGDSAEEPRVYRFNEGTTLFELVGSFPSGAMFFAGGVLTSATQQELIVRAGGYGTGPLYDVVQTFDPSSGDADELGVTLPTGRCLVGGGAVVGASLYVFGGNTESAACALPPVDNANPLLTEIVEVNIAPTEAVGVVGQLPRPVAGGCAVSRADGTIVMFGGVNYVEGPLGTFTRATSTDVTHFAPATGAVRAGATPLPVARAGLACAENDAGRIFLFGGADESLDATDEIWLFEPYAQSGTLTGELLDSGISNARWYDMVVDGDTPTGTYLHIKARAADESLDSAVWQDTDAAVELPRGRYLQWRATLETTNGYLTPSVRSISLRYSQ